MDKLSHNYLRAEDPLKINANGKTVVKQSSMEDFPFASSLRRMGAG
jgi:hypothetical protein